MALIVPYGIEIAYLRKSAPSYDKALIVPYGIEMRSEFAKEYSVPSALIVPYGIEIKLSDWLYPVRGKL